MYYYVSYNNYFGFCVIREADKKIIYSGDIEACNKKCRQLNYDVLIKYAYI